MPLIWSTRWRAWLIQASVGPTSYAALGESSSYSTNLRCRRGRLALRRTWLCRNLYSRLPNLRIGSREADGAGRREPRSASWPPKNQRLRRRAATAEHKPWFGIQRANGNVGVDVTVSGQCARRRDLRLRVSTQHPTLGGGAVPLFFLTLRTQNLKKGEATFLLSRDCGRGCPSTAARRPVTSTNRLLVGRCSRPPRPKGWR
jgi:hypothetical protein